MITDITWFTKDDIRNVIFQIIIIFLIFIIGRLIIRKTSNILDGIMKKSRRFDDGLRHFLISCLRAVLYALMVLVIAQHLGISNTSLAAIIASGGLAIGLALQGSLQNFAGGVLLLIMKPFAVGDYISCVNGEGTVKAIGLIYTTLQTPDNKAVSIPNGTLANGVITNGSYYRERRFEIPVGIPYSADIDKAKEILLHVMKEQDGLQKDKTFSAYVSALKESFVELTARGWVDISTCPDFILLQAELREKMMRALAADGISIPFPQMELHLTQGEKNNR